MPRKSSQEVRLQTYPVVDSTTNLTQIDTSNNTTNIDVSHRASVNLIHTQEKHTARWWLEFQARWWRNLMKIAVAFGYFRRPRPPMPSFTRKIHTSSPGHPKIKLEFYCPPDYEFQVRKGHRYPIILNFHGGGFTLGTAFDDRYYARVVLEEVPAVFVSVDYRLAPKHAFPAAVDDGVDTLLYLAAHASELGLNPSKTILTGFSAGANLSLTVPLRYQFHTLSPTTDDNIIPAVAPSSTTTTTHRPTLSRYASGNHLLHNTSAISVVAVVAWYPIVDFAASRDDRRATSIRPDKCLPRFFTTLFDQAYLPQGSDKTSPYVSPLLAPDDMLVNGLPDKVSLFVCEWDMLYAEGVNFGQRLIELGKDVQSTIVHNQPHAWDQSPNPFRDQKAIDDYYRKGCVQIRQAINEYDA